MNKRFVWEWFQGVSIGWEQDATDKVGYSSDRMGEKGSSIWDAYKVFFILEIVFCTGMQVKGLWGIEALQ